MENKTITTRDAYASFMATHYERTDTFTDDIVTTEDIQELANQIGIEWQSIVSINNMLTDFEFESRPIKNTPERVWKLRGK